MPLRIGTNMASLAAQRSLGRSEAKLEHAMRAISSGSRIVQAGDDAAGFAISEILRGQGQSLQQAGRNAEGAIGLIQVAEGGLNEQNNILIRLRELAVQSASDTVGDNERSFLNIEFTQLIDELDRIAHTTTYGNKKLLTGTGEEFVFQLGAGNDETDKIRFVLDADTTSQSLEIQGLTVETQEESQDVLEGLDSALLKIAGIRGSFGATQSRLQIASNNLSQQFENVESARSRIADADIAQEVSLLTQAQVQKDLGIAVLAQANQDPERALRLL